MVIVRTQNVMIIILFDFRIGRRLTGSVGLILGGIFCGSVWFVGDGKWTNRSIIIEFVYQCRGLWCFSY